MLLDMYDPQYVSQSETWERNRVGYEPRPECSLGFVEWCKHCHAPVSNWAEHEQRMGHGRANGAL